MPSRTNVEVGGMTCTVVTHLVYVYLSHVPRRLALKDIPNKFWDCKRKCLITIECFFGIICCSLTSIIPVSVLSFRKRERAQVDALNVACRVRSINWKQVWQIRVAMCSTWVPYVNIYYYARVKTPSWEVSNEMWKLIDGYRKSRQRSNVGSITVWLLAVRLSDRNQWNLPP